MENSQLKEKVATLESENSKLKETADYHYQTGLDKIKASDFPTAKSEFETVISKYPANLLVSSAKQRLSEVKIELDKIEVRRLAEEKKQQEAQRNPWRAKAKEIHNQIYEQGGLDMGHGIRTSVIDVVKSIVGNPDGSYEGGYGIVNYFEWGASLGDKPSTKEIQKAPFSVALPRDLDCRNYAAGMVDFYSYGKKIDVSN